MMERIDSRLPPQPDPPRQSEGASHVEDFVVAPLEPDRGLLRDGFFDGVTRLSGGLIRGERWRLRVGPATLFRFGAPQALDVGWSWPITGGLLVGRPGGTLTLAWREGRLVSTLDGYQPRLPRPLYRLTQLPLHPMVTHLVLLQLRGRVPAPGVPVGPAQRFAAAGIDLALCAGLALTARRRRLATFAAIAAGYHLGFWATTGRTPGGRLLGQRLVGVDGSPPSAIQALARLLTLPLGAVRLRAVHDEVAGTEVIEHAGPRGARG